MKKKDDKSIYYVLLICCSVMAWPLYMMCVQAVPEPSMPKIHSIGETQQELRDVGYPIKVDYKWGPETERAYCDYMANFTPSGGKE